MQAVESKRSVLHVAGWAWTLGGLQSVLGHHVKRDGALGWEPRVIALFDRAAPPDHPARLKVRAWTLIATARRRFARLASPAAAMAIYHDGWGLRWWADRDGVSRRVLYLHTETPQLEAKLRSVMPCVDGVLAISRSMIDRLRKVVPAFPAERCFLLPYFVEMPPLESPVDRPRDGPWRIGYAGRLERPHKRVDRLPALVAELDRLGLDYRFEIVGSGSAEPTLRRELAAHDRVAFHGRKSGDAYWRVLQTWDCLVLPSDYEGFSRVTMEAMSVGVLPIIPAYSAAAAEMVGPIGEAGLYPTGDMAAAARRIEDYTQASRERVVHWRREMREHLAGHSVEAYDAAYQRALERIHSMNPWSHVRHPARWETWLPLGLHTRLFPQTL